MESNEIKASSSAHYLSNGLLELMSLSELDTIMLTLLTPMTHKQWLANADEKQASHY